MHTTTTPLRVLITNNTAAVRAGSELYVLDLALGLLRRGHRPVVYSTVLGDVAEALRRATVPVIEDLNALSFVPDVIHGHHHLEAMTAALHFAGVPMVAFCHGWLPWEETPPVHPGIRRYVAVDDLCAERLLTTPGVDPARVRTLYNGVDLARFQPRATLPATPKRALIFSNYADARNYSTVIRAACERAGIAQVDVAGLCSGQPTDAPESLLREYDVVFAKARCALEAMAVGCATIVADRPGLGGLVTTGNFDRLRALNFGVRTMQAAPVTEAGVIAALSAYDATDSAVVSQRVRNEASFDALVDATVDLYREAIADAGDGDWPARTRAAAGYLRSLSPVLKSVERATQQARVAEVEHAAASRSNLALQAQIAETNARAVLAEDECNALRVRLEQTLEHAAAAEAAHTGAVHANATLAAQRDALGERLVTTEMALGDATTRGAATQAALDDAIARLVATQGALDDANARLCATQAILDDAHVELAAARAGLDAARHAESELHRSRAWRAILAYRRLRERLA